MPVVDVSGTINGTGIATAAPALIVGPGATAQGAGVVANQVTLGVELDDALTGTSTVTGGTEHVYIFSGTAKGSGVLTDDTLGLLTGTALGVATVTGSVLRIVNVSGYISGAGQFVISAPEPLHGVAIVTAHMEVIHHRPPLSCPTIPVAAFQWGQVFQKLDLCISVTDNVCNPIGPVNISYTLFRVVKGCQLHQAGCADRVPVMCKVGTYYVTGCAGEGGQPGLWVVRWKYQRSFADPVIEKDMCYQVLDGVLSPRDTTDRNCKYGWW